MREGCRRAPDFGFPSESCFERVCYQSCGGFLQAASPPTEMLLPRQGTRAPVAPSETSCATADRTTSRVTGSSPPADGWADMAGIWSSSARCSARKGSGWSATRFAISKIAAGQRGGAVAPSKVTVHPSAAPPQKPGRAEDMALVERCRKGDLSAFEEIYRAHSGRLYSLACRMLGNPADAEDLLQEIFLSAHRKLDGFRGESALGTWLYRLATNQCLDHLRSRAARTNQATDAIEDEAALSDTRSRSIAERTVAKMDLERALLRLPEGARAAFVLHDIQGLEHREVADALGIAEGTSKSQVHKARLRLRTILAGG